MRSTYFCRKNASTSDVSCTEHRALFNCSFTFVDALWQCFGCVLTGVTSVVVRADVSRNPLALATFMVQHRITVFVAVPSLLRCIYRLCWEREPLNRLPPMRLLISSGEPLCSSLAISLKTKFSPFGTVAFKFVRDHRGNCRFSRLWFFCELLELFSSFVSPRLSDSRESIISSSRLTFRAR